MAANVLLPLLIPLGEQLSNLTQLFGRDPVQFSQQQYNITVSEDAPLGPLLILKAITSPPGDTVHYSLLEGHRKGSAKWFKIDSDTGLLKLVKPLDYEKHKRHLFHISAGTSRGSGETSVLVSVLDANDHAPVFSRLHYETQITEEDDRHLPKPVLQVQAIDEDAGRWGMVTYYIEGDGINDVPTAAPAADDSKGGTQGTFRTRVSTNPFASSFPPLDPPWRFQKGRPKPSFSMTNSFSSSFPPPDPPWRLPVRGAKPSFSATGSQRTKRYPFPHPNTSIINTLLQNNSSLLLKSPFHKSLQRYYITNSTSHTPAFSVDPYTGTVYVMKPLDRDGPNGKARWKLRVTATDGQLEAVTGVQINLKDVNDNPPKFPKAVVQAAVPENAPAGTLVVTVEAHDPDDPDEAGNARLVYSLQKNVIDESTGRPIFSVDSLTGRISTALCCLDREHTGRYGLLLAATDGGGRQGTCTVMVEVRDVNDVPPRWALNEWVLQVPEEQPAGTVIAILPVTDPDRANRLAYRVVPGSGQGWDLVTVDPSPGGGGALLKSLIPLDYEDSSQREGLNFQVQVTDQGEGNWSEHHRAGVATVTLQVLDTNDNAPVFETSSAQQAIELSEDAVTGTILTTLLATDLDEGSGGLISYGISPPSDPGGVFAVDTGGTVRLARTLDREKTALHVLHVLAWDSGDPPNTATSTISVKVADINDNPPSLSSPRVLALPPLNFNHPSPAEVTFNLTLEDPDDWSVGNGPPFTVTIDPNTEVGLATFLKMKHKPGRVSKSGGVIVPFTAIIEREMGGVLGIPLKVVDSGSPPQSSTVTLTLARSSGPRSLAREHKHITVASVKSSGGIGLGRVRSSSSSTSSKDSSSTPGIGVGARYTWLQSHPLFSLNAHTGALTVAADAPTGVYDVQVSVSDVTATNVEVNVTVDLYHVNRHDVTMATPLDVSVPSAELVNKNEDGGSGTLLERLLVLLQRWATEFHSGNSLEAQKDAWNIKTVSIEEAFRDDGVTPLTRLWLAAPSHLPPSLDMLVHRNRENIEKELGANVIAIGASAIGHCSKNLGGCKCCCQDKVLVGENYILVDTPSSSHVGPTIHLVPYCGCSSERKAGTTSNSSRTHVASNVAPAAHAVLGEEPPSCQKDTCLNGGRCLPDSGLPLKCICPTHTYGPRCKVIHREFNRNHQPNNSDTFGSWAWLPSLPACSHLHITLHLLTKNLQGLLLYTSDTNKASYNPFMALQIANGRPQLILRLGTSGSVSTITLNTTLNDYKWHRLDILWKNQTVELMSDLCEDTSEASKIPIQAAASTQREYPTMMEDGTGYSCRDTARLPTLSSSFGWSAPLQLGGRADNDVGPTMHGPPIVHSFSGCISKVQINGRLQDLGPSLLSSGSRPGCSHVSCLRSTNTCPINSRCSGSPGRERCECLPGYTGPSCSQETTPVAFKDNSFIQLALSFSPPAYTTHLQLRMKTREVSGQLISLSSRHGRDSLSLELFGGKPCLELTLHPEEPSTLCLKQAINDGRWHSITALRQGNGLELTVDEGDEGLYRASLSPGRHNTLLHINSQEGVLIGGRPEYRRSSHATVHADYHNGCLDDIRLEGHLLPLDSSRGNNTSHSSRSSSAGAVSVAKGVSRGCAAPPMCLNVTCPTPFSCQDTWREKYCGCDEGFQVSRDGSACGDTNECQWNPCLNLGSCTNLQPGYRCECLAGYTGSNCEHGMPQGTLLASHMGLILTAVVSAAFLGAIIFVILLWYCYRRRHSSSLSKDSDLQEEISSTNIPFDSMNIQDYPVNSTDLLCKLPTHQQQQHYDPATKRSESVSVINLASSNCQVHLNELFEIKNQCGKMKQRSSFRETKRDPAMQALNLETGDLRCQSLESMVSPQASEVPCTCEHGSTIAMAQNIADVDILKIPSPQMFADPSPAPTSLQLHHRHCTTPVEARVGTPLQYAEGSMSTSALTGPASFLSLRRTMPGASDS